MSVRNGSNSDILKLQVEAYGLVRFVAIVPLHSTEESKGSVQSIVDLQRFLEKEIKELYHMDVTIAWIKDQRQNDLNPKSRVKDLLSDMDQMYPKSNQSREVSTNSRIQGVILKAITESPV
jgi:hypothetical protein